MGFSAKELTAMRCNARFMLPYVNTDESEKKKKEQRLCFECMLHCDYILYGF